MNKIAKTQFWIALIVGIPTLASAYPIFLLFLMDAIPFGLLMLLPFVGGYTLLFYYGKMAFKNPGKSTSGTIWLCSLIYNLILLGFSLFFLFSNSQEFTWVIGLVATVQLLSIILAILGLQGQRATNPELASTT